MKYKAGYKYQLTADLMVRVDLKEEISKDYITIENGMLMVDAGYAWDGPSGPAFDTSNFMRGSLIHDVLYQLMREELIPRTARKYADQLLRKMCREDGMSWVRAWWVYRGLRLFARKASLPSNSRPIMQAP